MQTYDNLITAIDAFKNEEVYSVIFIARDTGKNVVHNFNTVNEALKTDWTKQAAFCSFRITHRGETLLHNTRLGFTERILNSMEIERAVWDREKSIMEITLFSGARFIIKNVFWETYDYMANFCAFNRQKQGDRYILYNNHTPVINNKIVAENEFKERITDFENYLFAAANNEVLDLFSL
jgi:hypothetical protein